MASFVLARGHQLDVPRSACGAPATRKLHGTQAAIPVAQIGVVGKVGQLSTGEVPQVGRMMFADGVGQLTEAEVACMETPIAGDWGTRLGVGPESRHRVTEAVEGGLDVGIELPQGRHHSVTDCVAAVAGIEVAGIFSEREVPIVKIGLGCAIRHAEQRTDDPFFVMPCRHTCKTSDGGTSDQIQENAFGPVAGMVGGHEQA